MRRREAHPQPQWLTSIAIVTQRGRSISAPAVGVGDLPARAPTRPHSQYNARAAGPNYSAVIGKTRFITPIG